MAEQGHSNLAEKSLADSNETCNNCWLLKHNIFSFKDFSTESNTTVGLFRTAVMF